jgi:hypothetical protein
VPDATFPGTSKAVWPTPTEEWRRGQGLRDEDAGILYRDGTHDAGEDHETKQEQL